MKNKYKKATNQYELVEDNVSITDVIKETYNGSKMTVVKVDNTNNDSILNIINLNGDEINSDLLSLVSNHEILKKMVDDYI